ncbi:hypothetical protein SLA2020_180300 [Shorea laevis]
MKPESTSMVDTAGIGQWDSHSPLPYIHSGLGIVFGIIAVALLFLACYHRNSSPEESSSGKEEKFRETIAADVALEPDIVVVMAGDGHPTYVAKPSAPN